MSTREQVKNLVEHRFFQRFITFLIIFNGITLGLATSKTIMLDYGSLIEWLDILIVAIFTIEISLRIYTWRMAFFRDPWSLFDFFVVAISLMPAHGELSILRVLRVLRLFRLLTIVPQMRIIISALLGVIPGIGAVFMVLFLFFYVFAIMATHLFGEAFPEWFGTLGNSLFTLFQIMTLESWSMGIARPVMELFPAAWIFFVFYILIVTFIMVNLFIGLIVDAIFTIKEKDKQKKAANQPPELVETAQDTASEIKALRSEIAELNRLIRSNAQA